MQVHIGEKIKARAKEVRMGPTQLAMCINTSKQNVYGIYKRQSIDTELLFKISEVLDFDFFTYYRPKTSVKLDDPAGNYVVKSDFEALWEKIQRLETEISSIKKGK